MSPSDEKCTYKFGISCSKNAAWELAADYRPQKLISSQIYVEERQSGTK